MLEVTNRLCLLSSSSLHSTERIANVAALVYLSQLPEHTSFADDFGPMNLSSVFRFCRLVEMQTEKHEQGCVAVVTQIDSRSMTNAVFLLGAYLIMKLDFDPSRVESVFTSVYHRLVTYKDVSLGPQNFHLYLVDCWEGLWKAKQLSWVAFDDDGFNLSDYEECDSPLNADLHEIIPGKLIAMRGPRQLDNGRLYEDAAGGARNFSPAHYADILRQFDVQAVVRLNEADYDPAEFERQGLAVADLPFDDCSPPPPGVVAKFLAIAEGIPGALAVHCSAGLGRTGTLIAVYMIKHHGFTARQALGWLRIVRPGSVIGPQQQFLCDAEAALHRAGLRFRRRRSPPVGVPLDAPVSEVARFIDAAVAAAEAMEAVLLRGPSPCRRRSLPGHANPSYQAAAPAAASESASPPKEPQDGEGGKSRRELAQHVAQAAGSRAARVWSVWSANAGAPALPE